jgi:CRISPR-associated autoregulator DevR family
VNLWSISFAYKLGLGFHALNNEGAEGGNLMQPRRIDAGKVTYDGISGEIIRRHILENFVNICRERDIPRLPFSEALHPDRGPLGIRQSAKSLGIEKLTKETPVQLYRATRSAVESCAVLDVGGFLAPFGERSESGATGKVAPEAALAGNLAELGGKSDGGAPYTVKRDSVFDVAWLISENPQDFSITQHAAYRPSGSQSLFSQTMRSNTYGGIVRAELHRIGTDDYWYLHSPQIERLAISPEQRKDRQVALVEAIVNFIASPTGAKVAGWAPHVFLVEGAILLTSSRTAPFASPIKMEIGDESEPIKANPAYSDTMKKLENNSDTWYWEFKDAQGLLASVKGITEKIGNNDAKK